jgi:GT2 family glycosyltransferase
VPHAQAGRDAPWVTALVDLAAPVPDLSTDGSTHAFVTATYGRRVLGSVLVPAPLDPLPGALLGRHLVDRFARQLLHLQVEGVVFPTGDPDLSDDELPALSTSVIVATRDRPHDLERCLAAIAALDGPVGEVIVVDNGSTDARTEPVARAAGVTYLFEPHPGQDRARNRGLAHAVGDVVLFTDDDVQVHPRWLVELLRPFRDPLTMLTTGLVLPAVLDTDARRRFERYAGFSRGVERRVYDGTRVSPYTAGAIGAGASMAFRRECALWLGAFPEELGPGMPTGSGDDTFFFSEVLRAGYRAVYTPSALAFHTHRETEAALRHALRGYGNGLTSFLITAGLRHRDPAAVLVGGRYVAGYLATKLGHTLRRRGDAPPLGLVLAEARGVLDAPGGVRAARAITAARAPAPLPPAGPPSLFPRPHPTAVRVGEELPSLSVVIPSRGRRERLVHLLDALDEQEYPSGRLEYVVALDGDVDGSAAAVRAFATRARRPLTVVILDAPTDDPGHGNGAGAARNRGVRDAAGVVLVFLDDDVTPTHPGVLAAHGRAHAATDVEAAVVGPCAPDATVPDSLFAAKVRSWWVDHTGRLRHERPLLFWDLCTGNVSISRRAFTRLGGFAPLARREDWELGYRAARAGVPIAAALDASVEQVIDTDLRSALADRFREGRGDAAFARRHPEVLAWLSPSSWDDMPPVQRRLARWAMADPERRHRLVEAAVRAAAAAERTGLPRRFEQAVTVGTLASYWAGVGGECGGEKRWAELRRAGRAVEGPRPTLPLEDARTWSAPSPGECAEVVATFDGQPVAAVPVRRGGVPWSRQRFLAHVVQQASGFVGFQRARALAGGDALGVAV